ncbi:hypothetical protein SBRY_70207 [Actinacidiphila bryophytorum]|uniref:Uncharacterized protein n=1 Tax=Actinacidiphila bryophytorum TaxID=1436133 RepID=A0A9W4H6I7_9ACTN|nr:hypothetical protein SBRY_70207 [Actinacidiphila bryophytorum]
MADGRRAVRPARPHLRAAGRGLRRRRTLGGRPRRSLRGERGGRGLGRGGAVQLGLEPGPGAPGGAAAAREPTQGRRPLPAHRRRRGHGTGHRGSRGRHRTGAPAGAGLRGRPGPLHGRGHRLAGPAPRTHPPVRAGPADAGRGMRRRSPPLPRGRRPPRSDGHRGHGSGGCHGPARAGRRTPGRDRAGRPPRPRGTAPAPPRRRVPVGERPPPGPAPVRATEPGQARRTAPAPPRRRIPAGKQPGQRPPPGPAAVGAAGTGRAGRRRAGGRGGARRGVRRRAHGEHGCGRVAALPAAQPLPDGGAQDGGRAAAARQVVAGAGPLPRRLRRRAGHAGRRRVRGAARCGGLGRAAPGGAARAGLHPVARAAAPVLRSAVDGRRRPVGGDGHRRAAAGPAHRDAGHRHRRDRRLRRRRPARGGHHRHRPGDHPPLRAAQGPSTPHRIQPTLTARRFPHVLPNSGRRHGRRGLHRLAPGRGAGGLGPPGARHGAVQLLLVERLAGGPAAGRGGLRGRRAGRRPGPRLGARPGRGLRHRLPPGRADRDPVLLPRPALVRRHQRDRHPQRPRSGTRVGHPAPGAHLDQRDVRHRADRTDQRGPPDRHAVALCGVQGGRGPARRQLPRQFRHPRGDAAALQHLRAAAVDAGGDPDGDRAGRGGRDQGDARRPAADQGLHLRQGHRRRLPRGGDGPGPAGRGPDLQRRYGRRDLGRRPGAADRHPDGHRTGRAGGPAAAAPVRLRGDAAGVRRGPAARGDRLGAGPPAGGGPGPHHRLLPRPRAPRALQDGRLQRLTSRHIHTHGTPSP